MHGMYLTRREFWTAIHGMVLGAAFLILFTGVLAGLWMLKGNRLTEAGARMCACCTAIGAWGMALLAWAAVFVGTYMIYPWYRGGPPGTYPKALLLANPRTAQWHEFGMEWKEHIAWLAPILATAVAYSITRLGSGVTNHPKIRRALMMLLTVSFFCAAVAGLFGAMLHQAAPIR